MKLTLPIRFWRQQRRIGEKKFNPKIGNKNKSIILKFSAQMVPYAMPFKCLLSFLGYSSRSGKNILKLFSLPIFTSFFQSFFSFIRFLVFELKITFIYASALFMLFYVQCAHMWNRSFTFPHCSLFAKKRSIHIDQNWKCTFCTLCCF